MYIYLWGCMQTSATLCMSRYCNSWFVDFPIAPGPLGFLLTLLSATVNKTIESGRGTERSESRGSTRQFSVTAAKGGSTRKSRAPVTAAKKREHRPTGHNRRRREHTGRHLRGTIKPTHEKFMELRRDIVPKTQCALTTMKSDRHLPTYDQLAPYENNIMNPL